MSGAGEPMYLYRWYDADGVLLYVGITNYPLLRRVTHRSTTWWCLRSHVCHVDPTPVAHSRAVAEQAELATILRESPVFNRVGVDRAEAADRITAYVRSHGGPHAYPRPGRHVPSDLVRHVYRGIPASEVSDRRTRSILGLDVHHNTVAKIAETAERLADEISTTPTGHATDSAPATETTENGDPR